ncbi:hypothetical protein SAMN04487825_103141 [Prevotella sp. kh1p2]|nr:hypothetical protein SAMN04487825_103141 [Prevotella sp. kh1p2]SNU10475.1 hypothetical protein SAMN06298210_10329 [Prevotellaceae bacterium KH2P17]
MLTDCFVMIYYHIYILRKQQPVRLTKSHRALPYQQQKATKRHLSQRKLT